MRLAFQLRLRSLKIAIIINHQHHHLAHHLNNSVIIAIVIVIDIIVNATNETPTSLGPTSRRLQNGQIRGKKKRKLNENRIRFRNFLEIGGI